MPVDRAFIEVTLVDELEQKNKSIHGQFVRIRNASQWLKSDQVNNHLNLLERVKREKKNLDSCAYECVIPHGREEKKPRPDASERRK